MGIKVTLPWNQLGTGMKRHQIYKVTCVSLLRFWYVCGKDRQHYYQKELVIDDNNVDVVREQIYNEYVDCLGRSDTFDKDKKVKLIRKILCMEDK